VKSATQVKGNLFDKSMSNNLTVGADLQEINGIGATSPIPTNELRWIESDSLNNQRDNESYDKNSKNREERQLLQDDNDDDFPDCFNIFADPDPMQTFVFQWEIPHDNLRGEEHQIDVFLARINDQTNVENKKEGGDVVFESSGKTIKIELKGYKAELGQTLHSTGLTLWRASELLCNFILRKREQFVLNKKILEVSKCTNRSASIRISLFHSVNWVQ
jgi:hypothetical protein